MKTNKDREAVIVVDLGFGDAGKGTMIDWLARTRGAHTVVRFNGGAQAGHNVVTSDGRHHTFSQFGAATFVPGVRTHLSKHMIVSPPAMLVEADRLRAKGVGDAFARTTISGEALLTTPFQRAANRLREISRSEGRHGSCGMGIGEAVADGLLLGRSVPRAGDLRDLGGFARKLRWLQAHKRHHLGDTIKACRSIPVAADEIRWLEDDGMIDLYLDQVRAFTRLANIVDDDALGAILAAPGTVLFEGAQGVLLDEWAGFHPYTTWSTCTFENALGLLAEHGRYGGRVTRLGVMRAYQTRHGPGPFVTEDAALGRLIPDLHNRMDDWQRHFRVGWLDLVATRYALKVTCGVNALAVTGLDRLRDVPHWSVCTAYDTAAGRMKDVPPPGKRDLCAQEALTGTLMKASPVLDRDFDRGGTFDGRAREYLTRVGLALGTRVTVASFGPTAEDKRLL